MRDARNAMPWTVVVACHGFLLSLGLQLGWRDAAAAEPGPASFRMPAGHLPCIVQRVWVDGDFVSDRYRHVLDVWADHSPYDLIVMTTRARRELTDEDVHQQVKQAAAYARQKGMRMAMNLDVRLARSAFHKRYPDEMQQVIRLAEVPLKDSGAVPVSVSPLDLGDHMTGGTTPYLSLAGRVARVYRYRKGPAGIEPDSVQDITKECQVLNEYYNTNLPPYLREVWSDALAGGRVTYHPRYPRPEKEHDPDNSQTCLLRGPLMRAQCRVRLLNFIAKTPADCPVAVIFGQACAMNWAGPAHGEAGVKLAEQLRGAEFPADLIPSSEIGGKTLRGDETACVQSVVAGLKRRGVEPQAARGLSKVGIEIIAQGAPAPCQGHSRLIDGTRILMAAEKEPTGDPIQTTLKIGVQEVEVDALGIVGVRADGKGQLEAVAAGGLNYLRTGSTQISLPRRIDLALWRGADGRWHGALQDYEGDVPAALAAFTHDSARLAVPRPWKE